MLALPVLAVLTYRLARHWVGPVVAALTVALLLGNRAVLLFSTELAPYTVEAACTPAVLLLWLGARAPGVTPRGRWLRYGGLALLALLATPAAFLLAPLLLADLVAAARRRDLASLAPSVLVGLVTSWHVLLYAGRQRVPKLGQYWDETFLPRDPGGLLRGVWHGLASYVPKALTGGTSDRASARGDEVGMSAELRWLIATAMVALLVAGVVAATRERSVRPLPLVLFGALLAQVAASVLEMWPFTFNRVNTFLLPVAYVLGAVGASRLTRALWPERGYEIAVVLCLAAYGMFAVATWRQVAVVRERAPAAVFGQELREYADVVRARGGPGDVVLVVHPLAEKGWRYYMRYRDGGREVAPSRTFVVDRAGLDEAALRSFLAAHPDARRVYVVGLLGTKPVTLRGVFDAAEAHGFAQGETLRGATASLRVLTR